MIKKKKNVKDKEKNNKAKAVREHAGILS